MGLTIDTSVLIDFFTKKDLDRYRKSEILLKVARGVIPIYCPKIILAEIYGVLVRYSIKLANLGYNFAFNNFNLLGEEEIFGDVLRICKSTGSRDVDAYFAATAKLTNSILITNDRIMAENAKKYGIECYYLIEEFDTAMERIKELQ